MKKGKVIAFYCSSTSWGGLEMNAVRYALWMKEVGYTILVFGARETPFLRQAAMQGLDVRAVQRNRKYFDIVAARRLAKQFQSENVALVWFRDTRDMDTLGWAKRFAMSSFKLLYQQAMQFGVAKRDIFHTQRFRPIDAWVSTLDFLRNQVETATRFSKNKVHVVPLGVDTSRLRIGENLRNESRTHFGIDGGAFVFGVIGRLDPLKGQHLAIEALNRLHQMGHSSHLLLLGEPTLNEGDNYTRRLKALVAQYELEAFVHWHPYSPEVHLFYHAIDVFMLCSKGETFGTVTIEAMAMALPIIGTNSSGTPEILDNGLCGVLSDAEDTSAWANVMAWMVSHLEDAHVMGVLARKRFEQKYSKEISVRNMMDIVEKCTNKSD